MSILRTNKALALPMASTGDPENVFVLEQDDLAAEESFHYLKNILAASYDLTNAESAFYRANAEVILPSAAIIRSIAPFASDSFNYAGLPRHGALSLLFIFFSFFVCLFTDIAI